MFIQMLVVLIEISIAVFLIAMVFLVWFLRKLERRTHFTVNIEKTREDYIKLQKLIIPIEKYLRSLQGLASDSWKNRISMGKAFTGMIIALFSCNNFFFDRFNLEPRKYYSTRWWAAERESRFFLSRFLCEILISSGKEAGREIPRALRTNRTEEDDQRFEELLKDLENTLFISKGKATDLINHGYRTLSSIVTDNQIYYDKMLAGRAKEKDNPEEIRTLLNFFQPTGLSKDNFRREFVRKVRDFRNYIWSKLASGEKTIDKRAHLIWLYFRFIQKLFARMPLYVTQDLETNMDWQLYLRYSYLWDKLKDYCYITFEQELLGPPGLPLEVMGGFAKDVYRATGRHETFGARENLRLRLEGWLSRRKSFYLRWKVKHQEKDVF